MTRPAAIIARWLKRSLVGVVALLLNLLVIGAALVVLLQSSPAHLKPVIEEVTGRVLDRELQIGQILEFDLGRDTYLLATGVSLANPGWSENPEFATVGRLLIRINLPSLWQDGPVLIRRLELDELNLELLSPAGQAPNWDFWPAAGDEAMSAHESDVSLDLETAFPVVISEARINTGTVVYRDPDQDLQLQINKLALQEPQIDDLIRLDLDGDINGIPLQVKGQIGPTIALITQRNLNMDLQITWGNLRLQSRGSIDDLLNLAGPDLHLKVATPSSRPLLDALGMPEVRDGALQFEGHITDGHPGIALRASGSLAEFDLELAGKLSDPLRLEGVDMTFKLGGPSLAEAGAMAGVDDLPDMGFQVAGEIYREAGRLELRKAEFKLGDAWMTVDGYLPKFPKIDDWSVRFAGGQVNFTRLGPLLNGDDLPPILCDFNGQLEAAGESVEVIKLQINSPLSRLDIQGTVGLAPGYKGSRIKIDLVGKDLATAGTWLQLDDLPAQAFEASAELAIGDAGWQFNDVLFSAAGLQLRVSGVLDQFPDPASLDAKIAINSPNLASALLAYGLELEGLPVFPASVESSISGSPARLRIDEMQAKFGDSKLTVSGLIGDPRKLTELDLAVTIASPDLLKVLPAVNAESWPALGVDARGQISGSSAALAMKELKGNFGGAQGSLSGEWVFEPPHENSQIQLEANGPDLSAVLGPWLEHEIPADPFKVSLDADFPDGGLRVRQLEASLGANHLSGQIAVDQWKEPNNGHGILTLHGASSASLAQALGYDLLMPDTDYDLNVVVERSADWLRLNPLVLKLGKSDYAGRVDVQFADIPVINVDLHSKYISLPFLLPDPGELEAQKAAAGTPGGTENPALTKTLTPVQRAQRVIPDEPLDFSWLNNIQASIRYQVDKIHVREDLTSSAIVDFSITDGVLSSRRLHWDDTLIAGDAQLKIAALEEGAEIDLYLDFSRIPFVLMLGGEPKYLDNELYRGQFHASGASFRELAANADGVILFQGGGGRLNTRGLNLMVGDVFVEIINRLNPFVETNPYSEMLCHAGAMTIKGGKVDISPGIVIRAANMDIASGGGIDLASEALDIAVNTRARKGIGINTTKAVTPFIRVGGTLANPRLVLDKKGVALSGGAAVATGGLSILAESLWDRWVATAKNPCDNLLAEAAKQDPELYRTILERPPLGGD